MMQQVAEMALKCVSAVWCCGHWKPSRRYSCTSKLANLNSFNAKSMHLKITPLNKLTATYTVHCKESCVARYRHVHVLPDFTSQEFGMEPNVSMTVSSTFGSIPTSWLVKSGERWTGYINCTMPWLAFNIVAKVVNTDIGDPLLIKSQQAKSGTGLWRHNTGLHAFCYRIT